MGSRATITINTTTEITGEKETYHLYRHSGCYLEETGVDLLRLILLAERGEIRIDHKFHNLFFGKWKAVLNDEDYELTDDSEHHMDREYHYEMNVIQHGHFHNTFKVELKIYECKWHEIDGVETSVKKLIFDNVDKFHQFLKEEHPERLERAMNTKPMSFGTDGYSYIKKAYIIRKIVSDGIDEILDYANRDFDAAKNVAASETVKLVQEVYHNDEELKKEFMDALEESADAVLLSARLYDLPATFEVKEIKIL